VHGETVKLGIILLQFVLLSAVPELADAGRRRKTMRSTDIVRYICMYFNGSVLFTQNASFQPVIHDKEQINIHVTSRCVIDTAVANKNIYLTSPAMLYPANVENMVSS